MNIDPWEIIFVSSVSAINKALAASAGDPLKHLDIDTQEVKATIDFSRWAIIKGGSGSYVELKGEIASGTCSTQGLKSTSLKGGSIILKADLSLLPSDTGKTNQDLVLLARNKTIPLQSTPLPSAGEPVASSVLFEGAGVQDPLEKALLEECIADAISRRPAPIKYLLGTLNPSAINGHWLAPACSSEVYETGQDDGLGVIAVLGTTQKRDVSQFQRDLPSALMIGNGQLCVAISSELFIQHILVPVISKCFNISSSSFQRQRDGVYLCFTPIAMKSISKLGLDFNPVIKSITASISGSNVTLELNGRCDIKLNIYFSFTSKIQLAPKVDPQSGDIRFDVVGSPSFDHDIHVPWYDYVATVGTAVVDVFIPGFIALLVKLLTSSVEDHVKSQTDADSQIGDLQKVFVWNAAPDAKPMSCELSDTFVVHAQTGESSG